MQEVIILLITICMCLKWQQGKYQMCGASMRRKKAKRSVYCALRSWSTVVELLIYMTILTVCIRMNITRPRVRIFVVILSVIIIFEFIISANGTNTCVDNSKPFKHSFMS